MTQLEKVVSKFKANREAKNRPANAKAVTPQKAVNENLFNPNRETCWYSL